MPIFPFITQLATFGLRKLAEPARSKTAEQKKEDIIKPVGTTKPSIFDSVQNFIGSAPKQQRVKKEQISTPLGKFDKLTPSIFTTPEGISLRKIQERPQEIFRKETERAVKEGRLAETRPKIEKHRKTIKLNTLDKITQSLKGAGKQSLLQLAKMLPSVAKIIGESPLVDPDKPSTAFSAFKKTQQKEAERLGVELPKPRSLKDITGFDLAKFQKDLSNRLSAWGDQEVREISEQQQEVGTTIPIREVASIASGALSSLQYIGALYLTKSPAASLAMLTLAESQDTYINARNAGKSPEEAFRIFAVSAAGTAALEKLGFDNMLKSFGGKNVIAGLAQKSLFEGGQEVTQQIWQNLVDKVGYDKSKEWLDGTYDSLIGGFSGGVVGGGISQVSESAQNRTLNRIQDSLGVNEAQAMAFLEDMKNSVLGVKDAMSSKQELVGEQRPVGLKDTRKFVPEVSPEIVERERGERLIGEPLKPAPLRFFEKQAKQLTEDQFIDTLQGKLSSKEAKAYNKLESEVSEITRKGNNATKLEKAKLEKNLDKQNKILNNAKDRSIALRRSFLESSTPEQRAQVTALDFNTFQEDFRNYHKFINKKPGAVQPELGKIFEKQETAPTEQPIISPLETTKVREQLPQPVLGQEVAPEKTSGKLPKILGSKPAYLRVKELTALKNKVRTLSKGVRIGRKDLRAEFEAIRNEVKNYAKQNLDAGDATTAQVQSIINAITNAKTPRTLQNAIDQIEKVSEKSKKRSLLSFINKKLKRGKPKVGKSGVKEGRYLSSDQATLDRIKQVSTFSRDDAIELMKENAQLLESGDENQAEIQTDNFILDVFSDLKNRTSEELSVAAEVVSNVKGEIIDRAKSKKEAMEKRKAKIIEGVTESIAGGTDVKQLSREQASTIKQLLNKVDKWSHGFETLIEALTTNDPAKRERFQGVANLLARTILGARNGKNTMKMVNESAIMAKVADLFTPKQVNRVRNLTKHGAMMDAFEDTTKVNFIGNVKESDGSTKEVSLSQQEMLDIWLSSQRDSTRELMKKNGVVVDNNVYEYSKQFADLVEKNLDPKMKELGEFYKDVLESLKSVVAPVYERTFNVKFPSDTNYWMRSVDFTEDQKLPPKMRVASTMVSAIKESGTHNREIKVESATEKMFRYIEEIAQFTNFSPAVRQLKQIFGNKEVARLIKRKHGDYTFTLLNDFIDDLSQDKIQRLDKFSVRPIDWLRKHFVTAKVGGLNFNVFIKQLTSLPAYMEGVSPQEFFTGIVDFMKNPISNYKMLRDSSPFLQARIKGQGFERDFKEMTSRTPIERAINKRSWADTFMFLVKAGDKIPIVIGGYAHYKSKLKQFKDQGMSDKQAHERAIEDFERVSKLHQQASDIEDLNKLQRSGTFGKLMTTFGTTPIAYFRMTSLALQDMLSKRGTHPMSQKELEAWRELVFDFDGTNAKKLIKTIEEEQITGRKQRSTKEAVRERAKSTYRFALFGYILPLIFQWVARGFMLKDEDLKRIGAVGPLEMMPGYGEILTNLFNAIAGNERFDINLIPVIDDLNDIVDAIAATSKYFSDGTLTEADTRKILDGASKALGIATGIGIEPTTRTVQGAYDIFTNKSDDWKRLIWSEYSLYGPLQKVQQKTQLVKQELSGLEGEELRNKISALQKDNKLSKMVRFGLKMEQAADDLDIEVPDEIRELYYITDKDKKIDKIIKLLSDKNTVEERKEVMRLLIKANVFKIAGIDSTNKASHVKRIKNLIQTKGGGDKQKEQDIIDYLTGTGWISKDKKFLGKEVVKKDEELIKRLKADQQFNELMTENGTNKSVDVKNVNNFEKLDDMIKPISGNNVASATTTRESDGFPFPDFQSSTPGQWLRADINIANPNNADESADIVFHLVSPSGEVTSTPQTKENISAGKDKQEYGLQLKIPQDAQIGTWQVFVTINGEEVKGTRRNHSVKSGEAVNRYE